MRFIIGCVLIGILSLLFHYLLPGWWWAPALLALSVGFGLQRKGLMSFFCGF